MKEIDYLIERYPQLHSISNSIEEAYVLLEEIYQKEGKLLVAGNGGSAADAEHIAGELMKRFQRPRPLDTEFGEKLKQIDPERGKKLAANLERPLTAIPLVAHETLTTAYMNDVDALGVFAQQLLGYGKKGDAFLGISTSGNSENIIYAAVVAKAMNVSVIALTGSGGGKLSQYADVVVSVPETETYRVQELHLPIYHCWCKMLESRFFGERTV